MATGLASEPSRPGPGWEAGRSTFARLSSLLSLGIGVALVIAAVSSRSLALGVVASVVAAAALVSVLAAFGDRYRADASGIEYRNRWVRRALFAPRQLAWSEIDSIRIWRKKVLILGPRAGARLVIDGIDGFEELCAIALAETGIGREEQGRPERLD